MNRLRHCLLAIAAAFVLAVLGADACDATETPAGMVAIPAGAYVPLIRSTKDAPQIAVAPFLLDVQSVTNAEFLAFVTANPKWRRSSVSALFADSSYLEHWAADLELGPKAVVVTGGHSEDLVDLFFDGERMVEIHGETHPGGSAHGSGCTHSSAPTLPRRRTCRPKWAARSCRAPPSRR